MGLMPLCGDLYHAPAAVWPGALDLTFVAMVARSFIVAECMHYEVNRI